MNIIKYNRQEIEKLPDNIVLDIQGDNHVIDLNEFIGKGKLHIRLRGNNNKIYFGKNNVIERNLTIAGNNYNIKECEGSCIIGDNNRFRGNFIIYVPLYIDKKVQIGNNNLFAANCEIIGCIEHEVIDLETEQVLNNEQDVIIGNKNWIGRDVLFMNKSGIQDNSVVGIRSLVTKRFTESNILIAGQPAIKRKQNIDWRL